MVIFNTGLKDGTRDDEVAPNHDLRMPSSEGDTDSESEHFEDSDNMGDYMRIPCSGYSDDELNISSSEDESETNTETAEQQEPIAGPSEPSIEPIEKTLMKELWSQPNPKEVDFQLDNAKIEEVKEVMLNITLPAAAFPEWAKTIPEDQWKEQLIKRLQSKDSKI